MSTGYEGSTTYQDLTSLIGHHVYDAEGNKIGTAGTIYQSDETGAPEWITVKTGLFGTKESFVPLHGAEADEKGLHVAVHKDEVKDAPRIDEDGHLSDTETAELYRHYGLTAGGAARGGGRAGTGSDGVPTQRAEMGRDAARPTPADMQREATARSEYAGAGRQGAGQPADDERGRRSVLRSEERLRAGTETAEAGRVRLRKHVVTSQEQITVPVRREEVRVTREPVKPGEARTGTEIGDEEREVILHEERPVVAKETVPVERVSLDTETVQENREVNETVRREEVEIDDGRKRPRS
ncbi:MAG TPA: PRC and DUF2382 domain-containing protein [Trebonia sp.]|jgi:uncharacterized protein (TIGR02271 family)|nr:PRC and DUF2382 domain-containing protein [Trebonia sp.]